MPQTLPKACIKSGNMKDDDFLAYSINILNSLTLNATFPTPPVTVIALGGLIDAYTEALANAADLGKENIAAKNSTRKNLNNGLRTDLFYVNQTVQALISAGTSYDAAEVLILSSGYELNETPEPAGPLPAPVIQTYRSFIKGQLYLKVGANKNAKGYQLLYRVKGGPDDPWTAESKPNSRITQIGLTSGVNYEACVAYVGSNSARNYSAIIEQVII